MKNKKYKTPLVTFCEKHKITTLYIKATDTWQASTTVPHRASERGRSQREAVMKLGRRFELDGALNI